MSESPKLWRIIAGKTFITEDDDFEMLEHEFIVEGEDLCEVWKKHEKLFGNYEYIKASAVVS